jgi:hypothetical protein
MLLDRAALSALSDAQNPYAPLVLTNNRGYVSRHRSGQPHTAATVEEFDDRTEREVRRFEEWRRQHEVLRLIDSCQLTERYLCVTQQARSDSEQYQKYEEEADTPDSPQYEEEADTSDSPQDMEDADTPDWPQRGRRAYYARFIDSRVGSHKVLPPARRCFGKTISPSAAGRSAAAADGVRAREALAAVGRDASASASAAVPAGGGCARSRDASVLRRQGRSRSPTREIAARRRMQRH